MIETQSVPNVFQSQVRSRRPTPAINLGRLSELLLVIGLSIFSICCFDPKNVSQNGTLNGYRAKEAQLDGFRVRPIINFHGPTFEIQNSKDLWLKDGEQATFTWETFEIHWELAQEGVNCTFDGTEPAEKCSICDLCRGGCTIPVTGSYNISQYDALLAYKGFILDSKPDVLWTLAGTDYVVGCPMSGRTPVTITPSTNMVTRLMSPIQEGVTMEETKIHVLKSEQKDTVSYQLTGQTIDAVNYWTWEIPGDPWFENFSPNLRVTNIRVLKGRCSPDPLSGKCRAPSESIVQPSRILFFPGFAGSVTNYQGGEPLHRCYSNTSGTEEGAFFNLDTCRQTYSTGTLATAMKSVTPTYEFLPQNQFSKLTWLVEFNQQERADVDLSTPCDTAAPFAGCDVPALDQDLIIEFTLVAS
ncbi:MAG: hypothetical protein ABI878_01960 [Acidobacteriota bacterium]